MGSRWSRLVHFFYDCVGIKQIEEENDLYVENPHDEDEHLDGAGAVVRSFEEQGSEGLENVDGVVNEKIDVIESLLKHEEHEQVAVNVNVTNRIFIEPITALKRSSQRNDSHSVSVLSNSGLHYRKVSGSTCVILENPDCSESGSAHLDHDNTADLTLTNEEEQVNSQAREDSKKVPIVEDTVTIPESAAPSTCADSENDNEGVEFTETDTDNEEERRVVDVSFSDKKMYSQWKSLRTLYDTMKIGKDVFDRISLWRGDITKLEVDAIVNAANSGLRGGGGVDGAIHKAAGRTELQKECRQYDGCEVGNTVITHACGIKHVKKILHTVGPQVYGPLTETEKKQLVSCYRTAFDLCIKNGLRSVAFPCISTGIYGYPNDDAAERVMNFLYEFFTKDENQDKIDHVVIVLFMPIDVECYAHSSKQIAVKFKNDENDTTKEDEPMENSIKEENNDESVKNTTKHDEPLEKGTESEEISQENGAAGDFDSSTPEKVHRKSDDVFLNSGSGLSDEEATFADAETSPAPKKSKD